jgi:hypothetical protein
VTEPEELAAEQFARWWNETGERELCQILFWRWDPIGVANEFPNTADEYDDYAPGVVALLRLGAGEDLVAQHLDFLEREQMGLPEQDARHRAEAAGLITAWFESSIDLWADHGGS